MTGGTIALGITFAALCVATGITIGWPIGNRRGWKHAAEEAAWQQQDVRWKGLAGKLDAPAPVRPPAPPDAGPGKHRHPPGPRHADAELPAAGYLPAAPWDGMTLTMPAPAQAPPWDQPDRMLHVQGILRAGDDAPITDTPEPEPRTQVLEPTAVLSPDSLSDTGWTRQMARDMDAWIAEHIGATDSTLKAITK